MLTKTSAHHAPESRRRRRDRPPQLVAGTTLLDENVRDLRARSRRATRSPTRAIAEGAAGAPLQPDHRLRHAADRAGRARARAQPGDGRLRARLRVRRRRQADAVRRPAGDVPGHRARRRARGDAQLHRHPVDGELLGDGRARAIADALQGRRARRVSQRRRRRRAHAQQRLRHGRAGRGHATSCAARSPAMRAIRISPACSSSAWAARRTRSTRCSARRSSSEATAAARLSRIQDKGGTAKAIAAGVAMVKEMLPRANEVERETRAGEPSHRSACSAAAPTATRASPPIRRSAPRSICWCAMAAPRSFPRRRRSTAPSTCSRAARCRARSARSSSSASTGGRSTPRATRAR